MGKLPICLAALLMLGACGTRSSADVEPTPGAQPVPANMTLSPKSPADVVVTPNDITDRKYVSLGDIEVTVKKWTIFDKDPTPALVDDALRAKAAQMGADAVILVRYGTVGIGFWSWGQLDGQGRAVVFQR